MNDQIQTAREQVTATERDLANANRELQRSPTLEAALAVSGYETKLEQQRKSLDRLTTVAETFAHERETAALEQELAECEAQLTSDALERRLAPSIAREAAARADLFDVELEHGKMVAELVSVAGRASAIERQLGRVGRDPGRTIVNLQGDLRRLRRVGVNARLQEHAALDPAQKGHHQDPRRDALNGVLIP